MSRLLLCGALLLLLAGGVGAHPPVPEFIHCASDAIWTDRAQAGQWCCRCGDGDCCWPKESAQEPQSYTPLLPGMWLWELEPGSRTEQARPVQPATSEWREEEPLRAIDTETGKIYVRQDGAWVEEGRQKSASPCQQRLYEALTIAAKYLKPREQSLSFLNLGYPPTQQEVLRAEADRLDQQEADVVQIRQVLEQCREGRE